MAILRRDSEIDLCKFILKNIKTVGPWPVELIQDMCRGMGVICTEEEFAEALAALVREKKASFAIIAISHDNDYRIKEGKIKKELGLVFFND